MGMRWLCGFIYDISASKSYESVENENVNVDGSMKFILLWMFQAIIVCFHHVDFRDFSFCWGFLVWISIYVNYIIRSWRDERCQVGALVQLCSHFTLPASFGMTLAISDSDRMSVRVCWLPNLQLNTFTIQKTSQKPCRHLKHSRE